MDLPRSGDPAEAKCGLSPCFDSFKLKKNLIRSQSISPKGILGETFVTKLMS